MGAQIRGEAWVCLVVQKLPSFFHQCAEFGELLGESGAVFGVVEKAGGWEIPGDLLGKMARVARSHRRLSSLNCIWMSGTRSHLNAASATAPRSTRLYFKTSPGPVRRR